jgi:hypothetical protein
MGHEERFPWRRLSGRYGFRKQSVAVDDQGRGAGITASGDRCGWGTSRNLAPPTAHWKAGHVLRLAGLRSLGGAVIPGTSGSAASKASRVLLLVARPRPPAPRLPAGGRPPLFGPRSGAGHTGASPTLPFQRAGWGRLFTGFGMIDGIDGTVCRMARAGLRMSQGRLCGSRSRFHLVNMPRRSCHPAQAGRAADLDLPLHLPGHGRYARLRYTARSPRLGPTTC